MTDWMEERISAQKAEVARIIAKGYVAEGDAWTQYEFEAAFEIHGFGGPGVCVCTRKSDGQYGSVDFMHEPRIYYGFRPERR